MQKADFKPSCLCYSTCYERITLPGLGSGLGSIFLLPHYVFLLPEQGRFC